MPEAMYAVLQSLIMKARENFEGHSHAHTAEKQQRLRASYSVLAACYFRCCVGMLWLPDHMSGIRSYDHSIEQIQSAERRECCVFSASCDL